MGLYWLVISFLAAMSEDDIPPENWLQQLKKRLGRRHSEVAEEEPDESADQDDSDGIAPRKMSDDDDPPRIGPPGA